MEPAFVKSLLVKFPVLAPYAGLWIIGVGTFLLKDLPRKARDVFSKQFTTQMEIPSSEAEFNLVARFVEKVGIAQRRRSLRIRRGQISVGSGRHWFWYAGRPFQFTRRSKESSEHQHSGSDVEEITITILGRNQKPLRDFLTRAREVDEADRRISVYGWDGSHWCHIIKQKPRDLNSMILSQETREKLLAHLREFMSSEEWYRRNGIPYRTGICLYGPPGTGKTSLARAIASEFHLDLHLIDLAGTSDRLFKEAIWNAEKRSLIVLEDVDTIQATRDRGSTQTEGAKQDENGAQQSLTLGGLLNGIDGVVDSDGRIVLMTTNHLDLIDPALLRPGRIDLLIEMGFMSPEMFHVGFKKFFPEFHLPCNLSWREDVTPAKFQLFALENRQNPEAILALVSERASCGEERSYPRSARSPDRQQIMAAEG